MRFKTLAAAIALAVCGVLALAVPAWACPSLTVTASPTSLVAGSTTTITVAGVSNGNFSGAHITVASTGGPGTLASFTTLSSCGAGVTCTKVGAGYQLAVPTLTNGQAFSYTITLTINASTPSTTFTPTGEFFESNGTNIGAQSGPVITVTAATADANVAIPRVRSSNGTIISAINVGNNGPNTLTSATFTITANSPSFTFTSASTTGIAGGTCTVASLTVTCTVGTLAPHYGDEVDVTWTPPLLAIGSFTFTGTLTAVTPTDPNTANNTGTTPSCSYLTGLIPTC
jgi:hypothetical protein